MIDRPPAQLPLGLRLARTARTVTQAFERAMADVGGSASTWQVLLLVRSKQWDAQSRLAEAIGISSATLTHYLNALEDDGLVRRWRERGNRRVQRVELTPEGAATFDRLRPSPSATTNGYARSSATLNANSSPSSWTASATASRHRARHRPRRDTSTARRRPGRNDDARAQQAARATAPRGALRAGQPRCR